MKKINLLLLVIAFVAFTVSCKKDSKDTPAAKPSKPSISQGGEVVTVPAALKSNPDPNAGMCVSYIETANGIGDYFSWFDVPDNAQEVSLKSTNELYHTWLWSYNGSSVWTKWWEDLSKYYWEMDIAFNSGPRYNFMKAEETKDGKSGKLEYFDYVTTQQMIVKYTWETSSADVFTFVADVVSTFKYVVVVNPNNSGSVKLYLGESLYWEASWNVDGSGTWNMPGVGSGSWTAK